MNYYETLGIKENVSQEEIKDAYKKLAIKNHPDRGGDETKMKNINEAWESLKSIEKRQKYDQEEKLRKMTGGRNFNFNAGDRPNFNDIFSHVFRERSQGFKQKNKDVYIKISLTLEEVYAGKETDLEYNLPEGQMNKVHIKIPAGTPDGMRINYKGLGGKEFSDVPVGNLLIIVHYQAHPIFEIHGRDVVRFLEVNAFDLMLNNKVKANCIDGSNILINLPEGSDPGTQIRIKGKGMPVPGSDKKGDMILVLSISIPVLSSKQKELLRELKDE